MKQKELTPSGWWRSRAYKKGAQILKLRLNNPVLVQKSLNSSNTSLSDGVSQKTFSLSILPQSPEIEKQHALPPPPPPHKIQSALVSISEALKKKSPPIYEQWDTPQKLQRLVGKQKQMVNFDPCKYFGGIDPQERELGELFSDPRLSDMFKPLSEARSLYRSCSPRSNPAPRSYFVATPKHRPIGSATQKFLKKQSPKILEKGILKQSKTSRIKGASRIIKIGPKPILDGPLALQKARQSPRRASVNTPTSQEKRCAQKEQSSSFSFVKDMSYKKAANALSRPNSGSTMGTEQRVNSLSQDLRSQRHISSLSQRSTTISKKDDNYHRPSVVDQLPSELQALFDKLSKESRQIKAQNNTPQKSLKMYLSKPRREQQSDALIRSGTTNSCLKMKIPRSPMASQEWISRIPRPASTKHSFVKKKLQTVELSLQEEAKNTGYAKSER